ncbi:glycosyltransferase family 2 protein [Mangrovitalea sediminis]|uniref:glycosyltransferase family 2 protein n=1 Tax=Mangrovitalea sediminis TaxID=1982043 RepID=UPI000BE56BEC|nr:glycosyltransferase family 2 protein [Mangrovitalea sediminis]
MKTPDYSTTRHLTPEKPACFDTSQAGLTTLQKIPDHDGKIAEGGLRLQGQFKVSLNEKPLITVVTVVYNGADCLEGTIKSVIEQRYDNVEYIIVDGGSTDGTLDIVRKYEHAIDYWVSEPDKGIYDAMNKGIDLGSGQWINFMNAGDYFFDIDILCKIFRNSAVVSGADVIYGDHEVRYPNKTKIVKAGRIEKLWKGSQFCHQSVLVNLNQHKKNKFNICKKMAADFEFFYESSRNGSLMRHVACVISKISSGGVSDVRRIDSILEWWIVVDKKTVVNLFYIFRIIGEMLKGGVKKYLRK